jgi:DNA-binding CsgD family transcriptional regulator/PAS domain-containing protein
MDALLHDTISSLYHAAHDPRLWPGALGSAGDLIGAPRSMLTTFQQTTARLRRVHLSYRFDPASLQIFLDHFAHLDVWASPLHVLPLGVPGIGSHAVDNGDLHRTPIWNELMRLEKIEEVVGVVLNRQEGNVLWLGFYHDRPIGSDFSPNLDALRLLAPHFQRAIGLSQRLRDLERSAAGHRALLDGVPFGVLSLDATGRILDINEAATTLLSRNDGIANRRGHLHLSDPEAHRRLHQSLRHAAALRTGDALLAQRPSHRPPLRLLVVPAGPDLDHAALGDLSSNRRVLMLAEDPEIVPVIAPEALMRLFGLSHAESRLVAALASGSTVASYARDAHLSQGTVRQYLKGAMGKLGVHRQAELVALIRGSILGFSAPKLMPLASSMFKAFSPTEADQEC